MEPLLEGLLRSLGGSEANFLEVCFGRLPSGNFHTKVTSKKSRPPSGNFRPNPPRNFLRSPSRSFSSHEAGWKIISRARDIFGTSGPSSEKTTCSFSCRFRGNPGIRALYQAHGIASFKIERIQDRPQGLKFSNEIQNFKRATHQTPGFLWGILRAWRSGLKNSSARLKFSSEIENYKRDSIYSIFRPLGGGTRLRGLGA